MITSTCIGTEEEGAHLPIQTETTTTCIGVKPEIQTLAGTNITVTKCLGVDANGIQLSPNI